MRDSCSREREGGRGEREWGGDSISNSSCYFRDAQPYAVRDGLLEAGLSSRGGQSTQDSG